MNLRAAFAKLAGLFPDEHPDPDVPDPIDEAFRELPREEWIPRARILVLGQRGDLTLGSQSRRDPADRVEAIADLEPVIRSHRLRGLVEEERGLSRRGEWGGSGSGR